MMPITWATMWIGTLAIAGIFPFAGFFSKDEIIWSAGSVRLRRAVGRGAPRGVLTAGYMTRLMVLTFHGENRSGADAKPHIRRGAAGDVGPAGDPGRPVGGRRMGADPGGPSGLPAVDALHHWLNP